MAPSQYRAAAEAARPVGEDAAYAAGDSDVFSKTRLCKFYAKGRCTRGRTCTFAHGKAQLQPQPDFYRTRWCLDLVKSGRCPAGDHCKFAHSPQELREPSVHSGPTTNAQERSGSDVLARLQVAKQQLRDLQMQVVALHTRASLVPHPAHQVVAVTDPRPVQAADHLDLEDNCKEELPCPGGFSRQSTEEGAAAADDEQSDWGEVEWEEECSTAVYKPEDAPLEVTLLDNFISETAQKMAAVAGLSLVIRGTFIDVDDWANRPTLATRRSRSAPPRR